MMTFEETSIEQDTTKRSGLATVALICSLIICCPIVFETTDVTAECMYEILPKSGLEVSLHIDCIVIRDDKNGDIAFPKGSYCDTSQSEQNKKEDEVVSEPTS
jgi:hypothetical protein